MEGEHSSVTCGDINKDAIECYSEKSLDFVAVRQLWDQIPTPHNQAVLFVK